MDTGVSEFVGRFLYVEVRGFMRVIMHHDINPSVALQKCRTEIFHVPSQGMIL